jgi:2-polyprenyl-6-methoxyphenol hydroxylase-like FAD-dependent oxidoreductase
VPSDSPSSGKPVLGREFVWIWYDTLPEHSPDFADTFTDTDGKKHYSTVPKGKIQPKVWQRVRDEREDVVRNPHFIDLLKRTREPFVSAIRDCPATRSVFWGGKIVLLGDAFALCRPHAGGSTSQAAFQALELKKVLEGEIDLGEWEKRCVGSAEKELERSLGAAKFFFGGAMPQFVRDMVDKMEK